MSKYFILWLIGVPLSTLLVVVAIGRVFKSNYPPERTPSMNSVTVNGKTYRGNGSIVVNNGKVTIDGVPVDETPIDGILRVIVEGNVASIHADAPVEVSGNVEGDVSGSAIEIRGAVKGNVNGSVINCGSVGGSVNGSVVNRR